MIRFALVLFLVGVLVGCSSDISNNLDDGAPIGTGNQSSPDGINIPGVSIPSTSNSSNISDEENLLYARVLEKCGSINSSVCGSDGTTYLNTCWATEFGAKVAYAGSCVTSTITRITQLNVTPPNLESCLDDDKPVCGKDGITYKNECELINAKSTELVHFGNCKGVVSNTIGNSTCENTFDFVCGWNWISYQNKCLALHYGVGIASEGMCVGARPESIETLRKPCPVVANQTICGDDGIQYESLCHLSRAGVKPLFNTTC